jgi:hypothetical protein
LDSFVTDSDADKGKKGDVVRQVYFKEGGEGQKDTVMVLNWRAGTDGFQDSKAETTNLEHTNLEHSNTAAPPSQEGRRR